MNSNNETIRVKITKCNNSTECWYRHSINKCFNVIEFDRDFWQCYEMNGDPLILKSDCEVISPTIDKQEGGMNKLEEMENYFSGVWHQTNFKGHEVGEIIAGYLKEYHKSRTQEANQPIPTDLEGCRLTETEKHNMFKIMEWESFTKEFENVILQKVSALINNAELPSDEEFKEKCIWFFGENISENFIAEFYNWQNTKFQLLLAKQKEEHDKEMVEFAEWYCNGLTNVERASGDIKNQLDYWKENINK